MVYIIACSLSHVPQVPVKQLRAHRETVTAARLCFNDSFLLSCSSDTTAVLWVTSPPPPPPPVLTLLYS